MKTFSNAVTCLGTTYRNPIEDRERDKVRSWNQGAKQREKPWRGCEFVQGVVSELCFYHQFILMNVAVNFLSHYNYFVWQ